eukprot:scaffold3731_cov156-Amphora_coffeaeformis.AAC.1
MKFLTRSIRQMARWVGNHKLDRGPMEMNYCPEMAHDPPSFETNVNKPTARKCQSFGRFRGSRDMVPVP